MPGSCSRRTCWLSKACLVHTLPEPGRARLLLHPNGPPRDNYLGPQPLSPAPTAPPVAPVEPLWHTICALLQHLCSRQRPHQVPWPDAAAPPHFPASRLFGSTLLPAPD